MKRYKDIEIEKALSLRTRYKYSFAQLQKITGIPASTIRNWCKNEFIGARRDTLLNTNFRKRNSIKQSEIKSLKNFNYLNKNAAKILASIIYWCEGSKYPSTNKLDLTNSDPLLLETFIKLLRSGFTLNESKFRVKLQIHSGQNFSKLKTYWSNILDIPASQFMKPTVTIANGKKRRKDYMGTCTIRYSDYTIQLKLIGIYEQFGESASKLRRSRIAA